VTVSCDGDDVHASLLASSMASSFWAFRSSLLPRSRRRPLESALAPCHGREEQQQPGSEGGHPRADLDRVAHALEEG
jgi:hypothetical protein